MKKISFEKRILGLSFILLLPILFMAGKYYDKAYLLAKGSEASEIEKEMLEDFFARDFLLDVNGFLARKMGIKGLYSTMNMYVAEGNYIVSASPFTSTDYEYDQLCEFKDYLDSLGINLIYVNEPTKYTSDKLFMEQFGVKSYSNDNADRFLDRIKRAGINTIDIRKCMEMEGKKAEDMFYSSDHHFDAPSGLWVAQKMAEGLNQYAGYDIDLSLYDRNNYDFMLFEDCWLGEQGRKLGRRYVGLEDYTIVLPKFESSYTFLLSEGKKDGDFTDFINFYLLDEDEGFYENDSLHYAYNQYDCINHGSLFGKVLFLGDSYDQVTVPFLSLGVKELDSIIYRDYPKDKSIKELIEEKGYDTVVIAYAQFMIGAHDDPDSANYRSFDLNR